METKINVQEGFELGKRTYLQGVIYKKVCEKCGQEMIMDFGDCYLSYPQTGIYEEISMYCDNCDLEYIGVAEIKVDLVATIKEK